MVGGERSQDGVERRRSLGCGRDGDRIHLTWILGCDQPGGDAEGGKRERQRERTAVGGSHQRLGYASIGLPPGRQARKHAGAEQHGQEPAHVLT